MGYEHSYSKGRGRDSIHVVLYQWSATRPRNEVSEDGEVGFGFGYCSSKVEALFPHVSRDCNDRSVVETGAAQTISFWPLGKIVC